VTEGDNSPSKEELKAHRDEGYRAVGRYVVEFSLMVKEMRDQMTWRLRRPNDPVLLADVAFASATADPICMAFFEMCQMLCEHDSDEKKTAVNLRELVKSEISMRNDVAHGDWNVGYWSVTGLPGGGSTLPESVPPFGLRVKPGRKAGAFTPIEDDLDARSDEIDRLTKLFREYGRVCFGMHPRLFEGETMRVRDVVQLEKGQPVLGPKAIVFKSPLD
jgi:hypothetical protein